jgi:TM2 domain-containing membrane protein YozV
MNNSARFNPYISPKSRLATLLLCVLVGFLGIHRFYVGRIGTGILWLITGGFLGIGTLVDFIMICTGSFTDDDNKLIREWHG